MSKDTEIEVVVSGYAAKDEYDDVFIAVTSLDRHIPFPVDYRVERGYNVTNKLFGADKDFIDSLTNIQEVELEDA